jgi:hypothetical protein
MKNLNPVDNYLHGSWEALGEGAPLLVALAQLCTERWVHHKAAPSLDDLSAEARCLLYSARNRGIIEIRAVNSAFNAAARILAVYVERDEEHTIAFRDQKSPEVTLRFLEGFRQLCEHGLIVHHIYRDFSLAPQALELARKIKRSEVQDLLEQATEFGLHD